MKALALALAATATLVAILSSGVATPARSAPAAERTVSFAAPPKVLAHYGHIRSLSRTGSRFELRFDPAWWLGGVTANRAAVEDGVIRPGEAVPNDYYIRDESRRQLTYRVPASAAVTVLTFKAGGISSTRITVAELAQIVKGKNPRSRRLYDRGGHLGYWTRVALDTVRSLDQQYQP